jgi:MFS transporter, DHA2 family, multidrug resistance protein
MNAAPKSHPPLHRHDSARIGPAWKPRHSRWAIAMAVTIATFMEVLDTSIANVALPHIAGGLAATQTASTWILTSYLVSNAIILPMSAWLAVMMGRKRFYMTCVALFTMSSIACGFAPTLAMLIGFRVLQGAGGGGLGPSEQGILADTFAPADRGMAFALYGMAVIVAPAIGPALGGWVTDSYDWRWIFFINVPAGAVSLYLTWWMIDDPPYLVGQRKQAHRARWKIDLVGLLLLASFLGPLQVILDRGQEDNWFASHFIATLAIISTISVAGVIVWELAQEHPIVDLRLFRSRTYAFSNLMMFVLGFVLYGSVVILPQFLQTLMGYSATDAGMVLSPGGIAMVLLMPVAGGLVSRFDARWLIAGGFALSALALYHMTTIDLQMSYWTIVMLRIYQAGALAFLFVPINTLAYLDIPEGQNDDVSGMINLARNIGGSFGIALMTTLVTRRTQFHHAELSQNVTRYSSSLRDLSGQLSQFMSHGGISAADAGHTAVAQLYQGMQAQAATMAYIDAYWVMAVLCAAVVPLVFLMKKSDPSRGIVIG